MNDRTPVDEHAKDLQRIQNFTLMDDEFMSAVLSGNVEASELILSTILEEKTLTIDQSYSQKQVKNLFGRDVVLDVFCKDEEGRRFNVEIQRSDKGAAPKRARYHASLVDQKLLRPGQDFGALPETYVIFITESDFYKQQKPLYHIDRNVLETGLSFGDAQHIIYVNGENRSDTPLGRLMEDFHCSQTKDFHNDVLRKAVSYYKDTKEGQQAMCRELEAMREEYRTIGKAEGATQEQRNTVAKLLSRGQTPDEIIHLLDYPASLVYEVAEAQ